MAHGQEGSVRGRGAARAIARIRLPARDAESFVRSAKRAVPSNDGRTLPSTRWRSLIEGSRGAGGAACQRDSAPERRLQNVGAALTGAGAITGGIYPQPPGIGDTATTRERGILGGVLRRHPRELTNCGQLTTLNIPGIQVVPHRAGELSQ